ncbi:hypothetical protein CRE_22050 [Caenorhabditis remanei]|uniref:Sdz-33 F-box domain-containing protein n=1 Tax=Caenorhabditis remanei TaxID=31234 RepID=E3N3J7_CAERE|nr:hypothetical protein CRE_22050 [Caenorhabditis remanei]
MSSDWFTLESLLACTCNTITLLQSNLGNNDLNEVLKKWKAGGFPSLKYLSIHSQCITYNRTTILRMNSKELAGIVMQTVDGAKKATLKIIGRSFEMCVTPF